MVVAKRRLAIRRAIAAEQRRPLVQYWLESDQEAVGAMVPTAHDFLVGRIAAVGADLDQDVRRPVRERDRAVVVHREKV